MPELIGQSIGRYHIVAPLGEGGMATVYKAFDTRLESDVAIKFIRRENIPTNQMERMIVRFEREAKRMAKFQHPNIVKVMDYGEYQGSPYLVMPYLPGGTLKDLIKARGGKPFPYQEAARILSPVGRALQYAHEEDTIHRDVKPANILLTKGGQPMLADFGVAKILDLEEGQTLTGTGMGVGTPKYMAPEQWKNQVLPQTDVYALGVVFYEMITGRVPYDAETPAGMLEKQLTEPLPQAHMFVPALPQDVERVINKALARQPEERYADMAAFALDLEKLAALTSNAFQPAGDEQETIDDALGSQSSDQPSVFSPKTASSDKSAAQTYSTLDILVPSPVQPFPQHASSDRTPTPPASDTAKPVQAKNKPARKIILWVAACLVGLGLILTGFTVVQLNYTPTYPVSGTAIKTRISPMDGMEQEYVPGGEFLMGSSQADADAALKECGSDCEKKWFDAEVPQHTVFLDEFWIDKTEVTNGMYQKCVADGACQEPQKKSSSARSAYYGSPQYADYPVMYVDWNQANAYCQWAGGKLPSEAQWEKAARGTDVQKYPWGNEQPDCGRANFKGRNIWGKTTYCKGDTTRVGSYPGGANPYGALDMTGNVWEWVNDWYGENYYQNSPQKNPSGPDSGQDRELRGGSWSDASTDLRLAVRYVVSPDLKSNYNGFRCVGF